MDKKNYQKPNVTVIKLPDTPLLHAGSQPASAREFTIDEE